MPTTPAAPQSFRALGHALVDQLADHLERIAAAPEAVPVLAATRPSAQLARFDDDFVGGADPLALWAAVVAHSHHVHHPRSVGHQASAPVPVAALSDLVASFLNNSAAICEMGPVATAVERRVVRWMCDKLGFPGTAQGLLTSGGSLGNLTAVVETNGALAIVRSAACSKPQTSYLSSLPIFTDELNAPG